MKIYNPTGFSSSLTGSFSGSVKGTLTATGNIIPDVSGAYDIGSTAFPFKDLYITQNSLKFINDSTGEEIGRISVNSNTGDIKLLNTKNLTEEEKANLTAENVGAESLSPVSASAIWVSQSISPGHTNTSIGHTNQKFHTVHTQYVSASSTAISGDLTVGGKVTAQEFHTEFVSASIIYESGSTQFGNSNDDTHIFTGSLIVSGGIVGDVFSSNNFTAFSQGINIEPGDTAQSTFRFDSNKFRLFNGNVGELFSVSETGDATLQIPVGSGDPTLNIIATSTASGTGNPSIVLKRSNEETLKLEGVANVEGRISAVAAGVGNLTFYTGTGFSGIIDLNGRLGIGTNDPGARTHIYNVDNTLNQMAFKVDQRDGAAAIAGFYQAGTETHSFTTTGTNSAILRLKSEGINLIQLNTAGDSYFNGGNVGIGTGSPQDKLEIKSGYLRMYDPSSNINAGYPIRWASNNGGTNVTYANIYGITTSAGNRTGDLVFSTSNAGAPTERMRIDSIGSIIHKGPTGAGTNLQETWYYGTDSNYRLDLNQTVSSGLVKHSFDTVNAGTTYSNNLVLDRGKVGIGTASPEDGLHIYSPGNGKGLTVEATDGQYESAVIKLYPKSPSANERNWALSAYEIGSEDFTISSSTTKGGDPYGGNVRLLIDGLTGAIGIGNTSPQNYSGYKMLHIGNGATGGAGILKFGTGASADGPEIYAGVGASANKLLLNTNGSTNAMVLLGSSVGIGTDGPSEKFHVKNGTGDEITDFTVGTGGTVVISRNHAAAPNITTNFGSGRANINLTTSSVLTTKISTGDSYFNGGKLGIGNTSPAGKLHVVLSNDSNANVSDWSENEAVFTRGTTSRSPGIGFGVNTSGGSATISSLTPAISWNALDFRANYFNLYSAGGTLGIHQNTSGNVGIGGTTAPERLYVNGRIRTPEGQISPTFYIARNYANAWGSAAGYDDLGVGDFLNLRDHSIGNLLAFMHGSMGPFANGAESISWNAFRILFRWTRNANSYTAATVGFKVARYFYSSGWNDLSAEFTSTNGMDGDRGPRWAVSPWSSYSDFPNSTDVPGIGLKLHSSSETGAIVRIHAAYIQYKY